VDYNLRIKNDEDIHDVELRDKCEAVCPNGCLMPIRAALKLLGRRAYSQMLAMVFTYPPDFDAIWKWCPHCGSELIIQRKEK
jgi:hypothetical protein